MIQMAKVYEEKEPDDGFIDSKGFAIIEHLKCKGH